MPASASRPKSVTLATTRRRLGLFIALIAILLNPGWARADESTVPVPGKLSRKPAWLLLDPYTARHSLELALGMVGFRPLSERASRSGYTFAVGESVTTVRGAFAAGARLQQELRFVPSQALSLALSRYYWEAGPRLGPIEPMARVGFTLLGLDIARESFSFGMFSPRVGVGLWLKLGRARIGVSAFAEYWWRWLGQESAYVHGLTLHLEPELAPLRKQR